MADQADNRGLPFRPAQLVDKLTGPFRPGEGARPSTAAGVTPASPHQPEPQSQSPRNEVDVRTMIVGAETAFSGEITSCNRLIVEGTIDAKIDNCQHVLIDESGVFRGESSTDNADVRGSFDGVLVVRKRLLIRATGRVSGTVTYAEIEIEPGGKITGTLQMYGESTMPDPRRASAAKAMAASRRDRKSAHPQEYSASGMQARNARKRNRSDSPSA
jgi:cytoskeletal protein CcmA (bactofilin family)